MLDLFSAAMSPFCPHDASAIKKAPEAFAPSASVSWTSVASRVSGRSWGSRIWTWIPFFSVAPAWHCVDDANPMIESYLRRCPTSSHCSRVAVARAVLLPICCQILRRTGASPRSVAQSASSLQPVPDVFPCERLLRWRSGQGPSTQTMLSSRSGRRGCKYQRRTGPELFAASSPWCNVLESQTPANAQQRSRPWIARGPARKLGRLFPG